MLFEYIEQKRGGLDSMLCSEDFCFCFGFGSIDLD